MRRVEARIDAIGGGGAGVTLVDDVKVYAPLTAPGDRVRLAVRGERGAVEEILEASPHRVPAPCAHFGDCGGCALQHVSQDFYRQWKRDRVIEVLAKAGFGAGLVQPLHACPPASRRRAVFAVIRRGRGDPVFGFNRRASPTVVGIDNCAVLAPALAGALPGLRALAAACPARWRRFDLAATLCDNGVDVAIAGGDAVDDLDGGEIAALTGAAKAASVLRLTVAAAPVIAFETPFVQFGKARVVPPAGGFLQASRAGEAALQGFVSAHLKGAKRVADLFSGCGAFSFPLAEGAIVDAFDSDADAIASLDAAARQAGLRFPVRAHRRNLFDRPLTPGELSAYDGAVFDPPRAGARAQAEQLAQSAVPAIVGVSCNPATFARDAAILRDGGFALSQVLPVDQFVYSAHVELAGLFIRE